MCLGIPGRIARWIDRDPLFALADVDFDGISRQVHMACVPEAQEGDYVIVHAGVAICKIDAEEASSLLQQLQEQSHNDDEIPG